MQYTTAVSIVKMSRTIILTLALLLSIGFGSVAATSHGPALTECDSHDCAVAYATGNSAQADFQIVSVKDWSGGYITVGSLGIGLIP